MATTLQKGLLGYDPLEMQLQQQKMWSNLYGQAGSPYEKMGIGLAQIGGTLFGGESQAQSQTAVLNKVLQEVNQQYTPNTPEYFRAIAAALPDTMMEGKTYAATMAAKAEQEAQKLQREEVKFVTENPEQLNTAIQPSVTSAQALINRAVQANGGQPLNQQQVEALQSSTAYRNLIGLNAAQEAGFTKAEGTPDTAADKVIYKNLLKETGDPLQAALRFKNYKADLTQKGNTPLTAGTVKTSDISGFVNSVSTQTKPTRDKLTNYNELRNFVDQARGGNTEAVSQISRWLVRMSGDNQIGQNEVRQIANAGGFVERNVGGVQQFITGLPSKDKLNKIVQLIDSLEDKTGQDLNKRLDKLTKVWGTSELPAETIQYELGERYVTAAERKRRVQEAAAEATRQQATPFSFTPEQNSLLKKYTLPAKK